MMFLNKHCAPYVFGHRGFSQNYPENTLVSFQACIDNNVPGVELDVQVCKTGEVVIIHDFDLKRLANLDKKVSKCSLKELKSLDVGLHKSPDFKGEKIPTLEELFESCGDKLYYDIELKEEGIKDTSLVSKVIEILEKYNLQDNCMISSFNPFSLNRFIKKTKGTYDTALIYGKNDGPRLLWNGFPRHFVKCNILKPAFAQIDEKLMDKVKGKYIVSSWTINTREEAVRLLNLGVNGLCGNDPNLLNEVVKSDMV